LQRTHAPFHFVAELQTPPENAFDQSPGQQRHDREHNPARSANEGIFRPAHQLKGIEGD